MLVEDTFVSTLSDEAVTQGTDSLLLALGFERCLWEAPGGCEYRRGRQKASKAKRIDELPQRVRIMFERGRVTFAAALPTRSKPRPLHREMMLALAWAVRNTLAHGQPFAEAVADWTLVHERIEQEYTKRQRRRRIIGWLLGLLVLALLVWIVVMFVSA